MRLDLFLFQKELADSREKSKKLILSGLVTVNGKVVKKPSEQIDEADAVEVLADPFRFVGRGGEKLDAALSIFSVDPSGLRALDIGASTGGFTDCLLQHGAASVVALDAGVGQLHPKLQADPRVKNLEKYNARRIDATDIGDVELVVMDVSFISATYILPSVASVLPIGGTFICLIKPQFEAGRAALNKQGVVRREEDCIFAIERVLCAADNLGLQCTGLAASPILGGDGNREFLACFRRIEGRADHSNISVKETVKEKVVK